MLWIVRLLLFLAVLLPAPPSTAPEKGPVPLFVMMFTTPPIASAP